MSQNRSVPGKEFQVSDFEVEFCRVHGLPLPAEPPKVRKQQLLLFRNRAHLFNAQCAYSGKPIFSAIDPNRGFQIYDIDAWNSDSFDPGKLGRDYDFSKPFFPQFAEFVRSVPLPSLSVIRSSMENSDYTNGITGAKNCYLVFSGTANEDSMFSRNIRRCWKALDCIMADDCQLCYDCRNVRNCYNLKFSEACQSCSDSTFLYNCQSCADCFGCVNLSNKRYYFYNQKLTREDFQSRVAAIDLGSYKNLQRERVRFKGFLQQFPLKFCSGKSFEDSCGNYLNDCKNCRDSYFVSNSEDLEHCIWVSGGKNSLFHCCYGNNSELIYNSVSIGDNAFNIKFSIECVDGSHDCEYSWMCHGCSNCFGCVSLKRSSYCVFNRQYSKVEYAEIVGRIRAQMIAGGEYGKFFPPALSPFCYNRSDAGNFLPMARVDALALNFPWDDSEPVLEGRVSELPDHVRDTTDDVLSAVLICSESGKKYRLVRKEIEFYREQNIAVPRVSPFERLRVLASLLEVYPLTEVHCGACGVVLQSAYDSRRRVIYCEKCFQEEALRV